MCVCIYIYVYIYIYIYIFFLPSSLPLGTTALGEPWPPDICVYVCMCIYIYIYIYISDCVQTVYELLLLLNNLQVKHFYTNRERCEVLTVYLSRGTGVVVTGRRDIRQN